MLIVRLFSMGVLVTSSAGCLSLHITRPVEVSVSHTETGEPAAGVSVETDYSYMLVLNAPKALKTTTDSDGKAIIPVAFFTPGRVGSALRVNGPRGQYFSYPVTAIIKPTDRIESESSFDDGESYFVKLRPISWNAYNRLKRAAKQ
jgi:hypothetical protein